MAAGIYLNTDQVLKQTDILSNGGETNRCAIGTVATSQGWVLGNGYGDNNNRLVSDKHVVSKKSTIEQQWDIGAGYLGTGGVNLANNLQDHEREISIYGYWYYYSEDTGQGALMNTPETVVCKIDSIVVAGKFVTITIVNNPKETRRLPYLYQKGNVYGLNVVSSDAYINLKDSGFYIAGTSANANDKWVFNTDFNIYIAGNGASDGLYLIDKAITQPHISSPTSPTAPNYRRTQSFNNYTLNVSAGELRNDFLGKYNNTAVRLEGGSNSSITVDLIFETGH